MSTRGFAAIGLHCPKDPANVGATLRAAYVYDAAVVAIAGNRSGIKHPCNTMAAHKHMPVLTGDDLHDMIPHGCIPIAVDLVEGAVPLHTFKHPERAFYVFGPEDGTLGAKTLNWCKWKVMIPTRYCMNLAATVNVVLYDRMAKQLMKETS